MKARLMIILGSQAYDIGDHLKSIKLDDRVPENVTDAIQGILLDNDRMKKTGEKPFDPRRTQPL